MSGRLVLHLDMDAFFASVEKSEDPSLAGRPVIVGGTGGRGVVASASYEARAYGARSAMPVGQARRLCPQAVILPPRFELYRRASARLHAVLREVTPLVEGIGLDEAFLDVSAATTLFGPASAIAARLHRRVAEELSLTCSVGGGPNKLVAKLASEAAKPRPSLAGPVPGPGTVIVAEEEVLGFLWPLPVGALWGVGPASRERLRKLGVATVGELAALPEDALAGALGKAAGKLLHELAWGRDDRPVVAERAPKSIGHEETYPRDLSDPVELEQRLAFMADQVAGRVREAGMLARTVTVKLRYGDFTTLTRSHTFPVPIDSGPAFVAAARPLLASLSLRQGARLLGVSASGLIERGRAPGEQLQLDLDTAPGRRSGPPGRGTSKGPVPPPGPGAASAPSGAGPRWGEAMEAVDEVRARFGEGAVRPASAALRRASSAAKSAGARRLQLSLLVSALAALVALVPAAGASPVRSKVAGTDGSPPRDETLYTSGTSAFPPTSFNPLDRSSYTGTVGLLYETLFLYDPVRLKLVPWLASSGSWTGPTTYQIQLRRGVDWVSSRTGAVTGTLSGTDLAFSVRLAMSDKADPWHEDVASVQSVSAAGRTVTVRFKAPVGYPQWTRFLWHAPVLPAAVWSLLPAGQAAVAPNLSPVASGPMLLYSTSPRGACYRDNAHWWAKDALGLSFRFSYLCDLVSASSGKGLAELLDGRVDWSNQLLRGVANLAASKGAGYGIKTYYATPPYMIPAATAWLQMDLARAPMDDRDFRLAVAYALDPKAVADSAYTGTVEVANPTGLLPELSSWVDTKAVKKLGFYHSPSLAKKYLAKSGYRGEKLAFLVPAGKPDLSGAVAMLSSQLAKVGIHVSVETVPAPELSTDVADGHYDMVINPQVGVSVTPWEYFDTVYRLPISSAVSAGQNTERFSAPKDSALVEQAAATPLGDRTALAKLYDELQVDFLEQLPEIPLWYTGAWFQANTRFWKDYPASTSRNDQYTPVMWDGWLGSMTTVLALARLQRA